MKLSEVFQQHRCDERQYDAKCYTYSKSFNLHPCPKLLAELEAARPVQRGLDRESVEKIFFHWRVSKNLNWGWSETCAPLIDAICALALPEWGKPSKVDEIELARILGEIVGEASLQWIETPTGTFDSTGASQLVQRAVKRILSWASSSQKKEAVWCEHMKQDGKGNWTFEIENKDRGSTWSWSVPDCYAFFCAKCGAPRQTAPVALGK